MLFVNTNVSALRGMANLSDVTARMNKSFEQLSSGSRINSARDDAAGLQVSDRLETQIIGTRQASRNIQDGISAVQIADGAMSEITDIAFRMRQLAVQMSSNTYTRADREGAQMEVDELIASVTSIAEAANLGGDTPLLQGPDVDEATPPATDRDILLKLSGALEQSEANIKAYFGIQGDGTDEFNIDIVAGGGGAVASVWGSAGDVNRMEIGRADFLAGVGLIGGTAANDRVIAHEMVHAVMFNQYSASVISRNWFMEGTAELIHGADERLLADAGATATNFMTGWTGGAATSADYSRGYVAMRMLHDRMKEEGYSDGIRTFTESLADGQTTLDQSFQRFLGISETDFTDWVTNTGDSYINTKMDLTNDDVGAIGGFDADGMGIRNQIDSVGDSNSYSEQPLEGFKIANWHGGFEPPHKKTFQLHTGAQAGERTEFSIRGGTAERLGLSGVNVDANARGSIEVIDKAIKNIHEIRKELGATLNGLESHLRNNTNTVVNVSDSKSRITDTDFAKATATLTRNQIIQQASSSILAQANQRPNIALTLLGR
ncbi:flagellinolysin [Oceanospirillum sediminis]|uniref:Flagellin n=1 Tax=Oceanospirillum sediminis TaxID=2760088 RepID=A0A839IRA0_9GAMM|nr:flagellinolysin [Oceanospirillum sediminis]MBB1487072.1 flagellinolysin [Oceanospirillum sediminis]